MLPQASVAVQVRVIVLRFKHVSLEITSLIATVGVPPAQLSVADTEGVVGTSPKHLMVTFAGTPAKTGATLSLTVIICADVALFPQLSVAVQVRVIVLRLTHVSLETTSITVTTGAVSQASVAVTVAAAGTSETQVTVTFKGTPANVGAVMS